MNQIKKEKNTFCETLCMKCIYNYPYISKQIIYKIVGMIYELEMNEIKNIVEDEELLSNTVLDGLVELLTNEICKKEYKDNLCIAYVYLLKELKKYDECKDYIINYVSIKLKDEYLLDTKSVLKVINLITFQPLEYVIYIFMEDSLLKNIIKQIEKV